MERASVSRRVYVTILLCLRAVVRCRRQRHRRPASQHAAAAAASAASSAAAACVSLANRTFHKAKHQAPPAPQSLTLKFLPIGFYSSCAAARARSSSLQYSRDERAVATDVHGISDGATSCAWGLRHVKPEKLIIAF